MTMKDKTASLKWPLCVPFTKELVEVPFVKGFRCSLSFWTSLQMASPSWSALQWPIVLHWLDLKWIININLLYRVKLLINLKHPCWIKVSISFKTEGEFRLIGTLFAIEITGRGINEKFGLGWLGHFFPITVWKTFIKLHVKLYMVPCKWCSDIQQKTCMNYLEIPFVDCEETWKLVLRRGDVRPQFLQKKPVMCTESTLDSLVHSRKWSLHCYCGHWDDHYDIYYQHKQPYLVTITIYCTSLYWVEKCPQMLMWNNRLSKVVLKKS